MSDTQIQQAERLLESFRYEIAHSRQVRDLSVKLFDQLGALHRLGPEERSLLDCAALLHDIGWSVSREKHHKHTYQLIHDNRARLSAFTPAQIEIVALVARYHRKSPPSPDHEPFAALPAEDQHVVGKLAALLRIGDGLDRPHIQAVTDLRCEITDLRVLVRLAALTDPDGHVAGGERKADLFETIYGRPAAFALI